MPPPGDLVLDVAETAGHADFRSLHGPSNVGPLRCESRNSLFQLHHDKGYFVGRCRVENARAALEVLFDLLKGLLGIVKVCQEVLQLREHQGRELVLASLVAVAL